MADYISNNSPTPPPSNDGNNTLYFIVGGLVVLALIFGFVYFGNNGRIDTAMEPAAGTSASTTLNVIGSADQDEPQTTNRETTSTERSFGTDGNSASFRTETTTETEQ